MLHGSGCTQNIRICEKHQIIPSFSSFMSISLEDLPSVALTIPRPAIISLNSIVVTPANSAALEIDIFPTRYSSIARKIFNSNLVFNNTLKASLSRSDFEG